METERGTERERGRENLSGGGKQREHRKKKGEIGKDISVKAQRRNN